MKVHLHSSISSLNLNLQYTIHIEMVLTIEVIKLEKSFV